MSKAVFVVTKLVIQLLITNRNKPLKSLEYLANLKLTYRFSSPPTALLLSYYKN